MIRELAQRLLAGETQQSLIDELNQNKVTSVRGAKLGYTTFRRIMTRPRNAGLIQHNGTVLDQVRLPGEPILDIDTYHRIVALYAARRPGRPPSGRYVLSGGIAICGQPGCGTPLAGRPSGPNRKQYRCRKCHKTFVDAEHLDNWAGDWAIRELSNPEHTDAIERAELETERKRSKLSTELADCEETAIQIAGRLGRREITLARHDAVTRPLDARMAVLKAELDDLGHAQLAPPVGRQIPARDQRHIGWLESWQEGSNTDRRAMVSRALQGRRLVIGPGKPARFDPARITVR